MRAARSAQVRDELRLSFDANLEARIGRYLEISHHGVVANHHFAAASTECIELYRDGFYLSAVMVSQAVNEGIWKLVAERRAMHGLKHDALTERLVREGHISRQCADAADRIWGSFRNDVHHMNPKVAKIDFPALAKRNLQDLAVVEKELFGCDIKDGKLVLHHPEYWDGAEEGMVSAYLRLG